MYQYILVLLLFSYNVICDDCVVFNFEDNVGDNFMNVGAICAAGSSMWEQGEYSSISVEGPHENSTKFITPLAASSCMSSNIISFMSGGTVDIEVYLDPNNANDHVTIIAFQYVPTGDTDPTVGTIMLAALDPNLVRGWQTVSITLSGPSSFEGYITAMGAASDDSVILIDSIRYIAPLIDEELCPIYKQEDDFTTVPDEITTTTTTTFPETTSTETSTTSTETTLTLPETTTTETTPPSPETTTSLLTTIQETTTQTQTTTEYTTTITDIDLDSTVFTTTDYISETDSSEDTDDNGNTTELPLEEIDYSFWNAFTISMVLAICLIVLCLICLLFYKIGKSRAGKEVPQIIYTDYQDLPKPILMPRVTKAVSNPMKIGQHYP